MSKTKFASLHSGLLARKGQAEPAIPSALPHIAYTDNPPPEYSSEQPVPAVRRTAQEKPDEPNPKQILKLDTRRLNQEIETAFPHSEQRVYEAVQETPCACGPAADNLKEETGRRPKKKQKYQVSLRISAEQRRRLRTVAAQLGVSNQQVLQDALSSHLDRLGQSELKTCRCLARQNRQKDSANQQFI